MKIVESSFVPSKVEVIRKWSKDNSDQLKDAFNYKKSKTIAERNARPLRVLEEFFSDKFAYRVLEIGYLRKVLRPEGEEEKKVVYYFALKRYQSKVGGEWKLGAAKEFDEIKNKLGEKYEDWNRDRVNQ